MNINVSPIFVYSVTEIPLDNLACCGKNATMSSISADRPPGRAIDGMTNTSSCDDTFSPTYKTCAVSSINDNPWWAVDLGFRYFISTVIITSGVSEGKADVSSVSEEHVNHSNDLCPKNSKRDIM